jgi:hypothetical protein
LGDFGAEDMFWRHQPDPLIDCLDLNWYLKSSALAAAVRNSLVKYDG